MDVNFSWGMRRFGLGASIGLVHLDHPQHTLATVLTAADMSCYKAKDRGRNRVEVYQPDDPHLLARFGEMAWAQRLQSALQENRFSVGEAVETPDIVHVLQQIGVNYGQGFAIGHPEPWSNP